MAPLGRIEAETFQFEFEGKNNMLKIWSVNIDLHYLEFLEAQNQVKMSTFTNAPSRHKIYGVASLKPNKNCFVRIYKYLHDGLRFG